MKLVANWRTKLVWLLAAYAMIGAVVLTAGLTRGWSHTLTALGDWVQSPALYLLAIVVLLVSIANGVRKK